MTTYTTNLTAQPILGGVLRVLIAPFRFVGNVLIALAETNSNYHAVEQLNALSDEDLAAQGTTRDAEIRRIFASAGVV